MLFERTIRPLFLAGALAAGAPIPAHAGGRLIWLEMCDTLHPGRKIPLPIDRDNGPSGQACHAACGVLPERRTTNRA